jgi:hypothetical protein
MNNSNGVSIGFLGALQILFIAFKLSGIIAWSWFWVLSPILFSVIVSVSVLSAIILMCFFMSLVMYLMDD